MTREPTGDSHDAGIRSATVEQPGASPTVSRDRCRVHRMSTESGARRMVRPANKMLAPTATSTVARTLRKPGRALRVALMLARGWWYKLWFRLRGLRFQAGRNLRASGRLRIRGPGRVVLGDNVHIDGLVTPWTYTAEAVISI